MNYTVKTLTPLRPTLWRSCRTLAIATGSFALIGNSLTAQQTSAAGAETDAEEVIALSPFTVNAEEDRGYQATNTLAGTRIRTELKDIGSAISVVTKQFLEDTGSTDNESLLVYTTNTETGGIQGNYTGLGGGEALNEGNALARPNTNNRVRGLNRADNTRDFFLTDIPWDTYAVDRIDLQRGPNAILFGLGSPAGIINATSSTAAFNDTGRVDVRIGSFGTYRGSFNINEEIIDDELAVRVAGLLERQKFQQDPAFEEDDRLFFAARWEPSFLKTDSMTTSLTSNYESGSITSNRPRTLPPEDRITPWFDLLNKTVYNPLEAYAPNPAIPGSGANTGGDPNYQPAIDQLFAGQQIRFTDPNSNAQDGFLRWGEVGGSQLFGIGPAGTIDEDVAMTPFWRSVAIANYPDYAQNANLPFANTLAPFKRKSLTDPSIFDYRNNLLDGTNKREWRDFDVINLKLSQTFFSNRLGFELAYDQQDYGDRSFSPLEGSPAITVDINTHLAPNLDPNPNVGRPYVYTRAAFGSRARQTDREVVQATAYANIRADDFMERSWFTKLLGRHVMTAFTSTQDIEQADQAFGSYRVDDSFSKSVGYSEFDIVQNELAFMSYLGPSLLDANSASGANISRINARQVPAASSILFFDSNWNSPGVDPAALWTRPYDGASSTQSENPSNYVGWAQGPVTILSAETEAGSKGITRLANKQLDTIDSTAFVWQAFLWDGALVPTYGYRKDESETFSTNLTSGTSAIDLDDGSYVLPSIPNNTVEGSSNSWSVVLHTDRFLPEMPWNSKVSLFYNESSNFQPIAGRINHLAQPLGAVSGDTTDYGFVLSTMDGRVNFKVNWYETNVKDASFDPGGIWVIGAQEARAIRAAKRFEANLNGDPGSNGWWYRPQNGQTQAEATTEQRLHVDSVLGNMPDASFLEAWGMDLEDGWKKNWWLGGSQPTGITSTADTSSEGIEFEMSLEPTKNLSIILNASKVKALNTNIAGSLKEFVAERNDHWNGPAGDIRMWWGGGTSSILKQWNQLFYSKYQLALQQEGTNVPELRPWRFNAIANYRFSEGLLNGFNLGGSVRWEDEVAIGYPVFNDTADGQDKFDVANPYWGEARENVDLWVGYNRKLTDKIRWRIQLNLKNIFASDDLIPITVQGDGSPGTYRIPNSKEFMLTNTFSF